MLLPAGSFIEILIRICWRTLRYQWGIYPIQKTAESRYALPMSKLLSLAEETPFVPGGIASLIVLAMSDE